MSEVPKGWVECTAGDLVQLIRGVSYDKAEARHEGGPGYVPILRATNIDESLNFEELVYVPKKNVSEEQELLVGDVVIAASSGSKSVVGKAGQLGEKWSGSFGAFCMGIRPSEELNPRYMGYYFQTPGYRQTVSRLAAGSNINNLKREHIANLRFGLAPTGEQLRIAAKLDELLSDLDAGNAALERARVNLRRYCAAVLKAAVEGRLTKKWRAAHPDAEPAGKLLERILAERRKKWEEAQLEKYAEKRQAPPKGWKEKYAEPAKADIAELPALPEGWCWASVGQVAEIQGGIQKQPMRAPKGNAFPYLRVGNVLRNRLDLSRMERFELSDEELRRLRLEVGDLLVVEGNGSRNEIGRSALWRGEIENCVHQNHIIRVRFMAGLPEFLNGYWNSPPGMARVAAKSASTSGLYTLSASKVSELPIPLPSPEEQREIVAEVDKCCSNLEHDVTALEVMRVRASRLRQSILKRTFEGKLVPQDPKDEPASELLARIRKGREAGAEAGSKIRKRIRWNSVGES